LIAIRNMARHDILFLHSRKDWFEQYDARFGSDFDHADGLAGYEHHIVTAYLQAKAAFATPVTSPSHAPVVP
jgi:heptaprenyl diphosphate synthase